MPVVRPCPPSSFVPPLNSVHNPHKFSLTLTFMKNLSAFPPTGLVLLHTGAFEINEGGGTAPFARSAY